jgi:thiol-disulfide isomerase/thioredoxin
MNKFLSFCLILGLSMMLLSCSQSSGTVENDKPVVTEIGEDTDWKKIPMDPKALDDKPGVEIVLETNGFSTGEMYIANYFGDKQYIKDTFQVAGNKAIIKNAKKYPRGIYMFVFPPRNTYLEFIMGYDQHFKVKIDTTAANMISSIEVSGSVENEAFYNNLKFTDKVGAEITPLQAEYDLQVDKGSVKAKELATQLQALYDKMTDNRDKIAVEHPSYFYSKILRFMKDPVVPENPDTTDKDFAYRYYKSNYWKNMDWSEAGMVNTPILEGKLSSYMDRLVVQHPDSLAKEACMLIDMSKANDTVFQTTTVTLLNKYAKSKIMGFDAVYVSIVEHTYSKGLAFWAEEDQVQKIMDRARALSPTLVGGKTPPVVMKDVNDQTVDIYQIPGDYMILYFWDYDCGHCKKVTPALAKLYPKYKGKNIPLVTVSINGAVNVWKEKLKEYGMDKTGGIHLQDHARATGFDKLYDLRTTPRLFLLDKDKKIMAKQISVEQLEEILDRELEEKS